MIAKRIASTVNGRTEGRIVRLPTELRRATDAHVRVPQRCAASARTFSSARTERGARPAIGLDTRLFGAAILVVVAGASRVHASAAAESTARADVCSRNVDQGRATTGGAFVSPVAGRRAYRMPKSGQWVRAERTNAARVGCAGAVLASTEALERDLMAVDDVIWLHGRTGCRGRGRGIDHRFHRPGDLRRLRGRWRGPGGRVIRDAPHKQDGGQHQVAHPAEATGQRRRASILADSRQVAS